MAHRVVRPFTVEVRKSGRKSILSEPNTPLDVHPRAAQRLFANAAAPVVDTQSVWGGAELTGRVLLAHEEPKPIEVKPPIRRTQPRHRKPPSPAASTRTGSDGDMNLMTSAADTAEWPREPDQPIGGTKTAPEAALPDLSDPEADPAVMEPVGYVDDLALRNSARAIAATLLMRQGRARLPRSAFTRGERWKARLPAVVARSKRHAASKPA